jgi:hypothetical protein
MLFKILDNLRSKPKHVRDQYALGIALFCTFVIGGVWSLSLPSRFGGDSQVAALASTTNAAPFSNFFTQLKSQFIDIKDTIDNLPVATSTRPVSIASSTEAALELKITPENREQLRDETVTDQGTKIQFGNGTAATSTNDSYSQTVIVASTTQNR